MHPLKRYLKETGLTPGEFGEKVGLSGNMITKISAHKDASYFRRPTWPAMRRIALATGGRVMPNDFVFPDGLPEDIGRKCGLRTSETAPLMPAA